MEGESDRREGEDSPEDTADGRDDYREVRARDFESRQTEHGRARSDTRKVPKQDGGTPATEIKDETAEAPLSFHHVNSPLNGDGRSAPSAEPESRSDLERFRQDLSEKYFQEKESQGNKLEYRDVSDAAGKSEVGQESDPSASEDARFGLEWYRKEIGGKQDGSGEGAERIPITDPGASASSLDRDTGDDGKGKTVVSGSEIRDSGDKIESQEREPEKAVWSDKSARKVDSEVHEQTPLAKDVGLGRDPPTKSGKELADLERIGASDKENGSPGRKESETRMTHGISAPETPQQEKLDKGGVIPVNARLHQSNPVVITFDIPKRDIEEKTGVRIEEGKLYRIKGNVGGKYDFEMYRTVDSYVRHSVPVEHHHQIQGGKTYDIGITSVEEVPLTKAQSQLVSEWRDRGVPWNRIAYRINHMQPEQAEEQIQPSQKKSAAGEVERLHQLEKLERVENIGATFVAESRLQKRDIANPRDRFYFRIDNSEYKQKTGVAIEEGATYKISGEIEGVGTFQKKLRSVAAGQDMPIYVPHELKNKVELGKEYKITINSVERIPSVRDSWEKLERPSLEWTWKEIASWIDTEGRINSESGFYADIAQKDKRVIEEICGFYQEHGLRPNMTLQKGTGCYHAHLARVDDVAMVVKNIEPYIRTENKKEQIRQFKEKLRAPRKTLHGGIREARKILDLE